LSRNVTPIRPESQLITAFTHRRSNPASHSQLAQKSRLKEVPAGEWIKRFGFCAGCPENWMRLLKNRRVNDKGVNVRVNRSCIVGNPDNENLWPDRILNGRVARYTFLIRFLIGHTSSTSKNSQRPHSVYQDVVVLGG